MERTEVTVLVCKTCAQTFGSHELIYTHLVERHGEDTVIPAVEGRRAPA